MIEIESNNNIHVEKFMETKEKNNERVMFKKLIYCFGNQCEFAKLINFPVVCKFFCSFFFTIQNFIYRFTRL